eukprot:8948365-Pyramimonas_sp.AAC.1
MRHHDEGGQFTQKNRARLRPGPSEGQGENSYNQRPRPRGTPRPVPAGASVPGIDSDVEPSPQVRGGKARRGVGAVT